MKIAYVCFTYDTAAYEYTRGLAALGCDVHAIVSMRPGEAERERINQVWVTRTAERGVVASVDSFQFPFALFLKDAFQVLSKVSDWDIVHIRQLPGVSLLARTTRRNSRAFVMEIQTPPLRQGWRLRMSKLRIALESRAFARTFVHSRAVADDIFGSGNERIVELPVGVNLDRFSPGENPGLRKQLGVAADQKLLVYTGAITKLRALDKLIEAFHRAQSELGNLHLVLIGAGDGLESLRLRARNLGLSERIHLQGMVPYTQVPDYLRAADIGLAYVPITPWYNKNPVYKTLESLACGLPTIATATQGNKRYIIDGHNGLLVEDEPGHLAAAITELCRREDLRCQFQSVARDTVRDYEWQNIVGRVLVPTYEKVVGAR